MIPLLGADTYTVTRPGTSTYGLDGLLTAATPSSFAIQASIQPMSQRQLQRAPEGVRASKGIRIFAQLTPALRTADVLQMADLITYEGVVYQVRLVNPFNPRMPLPHIEAEAYASETGEVLP